MLSNFQSYLPQIYWFIAIFGSTVLILQFILTMIGIAGDHEIGDIEAHDITDINGLSFFSIKSITGFIAFFGWGGVLFGGNGVTSFVIAIASGLVMAVLITLVTFLMLKMQQNGNIENKDIIGKTGTVYLSIPQNRLPGGIVTVNLDKCTRQISVRSDVEIPTGSDVKVLEDLGNGIFLVEKL